MTDELKANAMQASPAQTGRTRVDRVPAEVTQCLRDGETALGIELGSTRIKACLIGPDHQPLATGSHSWENELVDGTWTYSIEAIRSGLRACYADLTSRVQERYGMQPTTYRALGVSAMMHGYLAFDADGALLVPFRTWRNTSTAKAASDLSDLLGVNIPQRWSIAHFYQAVLNGEEHVPHVRFLTTLAGYVHWLLTGRRVLGVGDASGMFPIDPRTRDYDAAMVAAVDARLAELGHRGGIADLLPEVLVAGHEAGQLTAQGAALLDPSGVLQPGIPLCPPEGDAGTGMVATNSVARRTGNVSVGTSVFAMVVLEKALAQAHPEVDLVTTPAGDPVAMVHCNNGASELAGWAGVFARFAEALGCDADSDAVFGALLREALAGDPDGGGLLAYNHQSGEPIAGLAEGRPLIVRLPDSTFTLANLARSLVYGVFGTLSLGMQILAAEGVRLDTMFAHGGLFRTEQVAQRLLAGALDVPVAVERSAGEGGAWGIAVLAAYLCTEPAVGLEEFLATRVFAKADINVVKPGPEDVRGYAAFLERYRAGLTIEQVATDAI